MCEFETATDAPITYAELEVLIRLIIEDFTLNSYQFDGLI